MSAGIYQLVFLLDHGKISIPLRLPAQVARHRNSGIFGVEGCGKLKGWASPGSALNGALKSGVELALIEDRQTAKPHSERTNVSSAACSRERDFLFGARRRRLDADDMAYEKA
jgi:hypothetical protein